QGVAVTLGKVILSDSADNWFYADMILIWGGNPAYTNIANYHFLSEARYHGAKVVAITPDYNASAIHADQWVPVNVGSDAALALAMAQVILAENRYKEEFVREQTDLPLLVRADTGRFLRESDLQRGASDEVFACYDTVSGKVVKAPKKTLTLNGLVPALSGEYTVNTIHGRVKVQPVMELLRRKLDTEYTPEQASSVTGVPPATIRQLAREFAAARGVVKMCTANWGKFYHGDLVERATLLLFALCGHMGRKGASYNAFAMLALDTALGGMERHGDDVILTAAGADPRFARWREEGFTDEMILYEYVRDAFASGSITPTSLLYFLHGGLLELSEKHNSWDPYLKRPVAEYVREAFDKKWQFLTPGRDKAPRVMFATGGNFLRRARATTQLIETLLPKLKLIVTLDWRMGSTGLYSDYVLPVASWYERDALWLMGMPVAPWAHLNRKATEPLGEAKSEWELFVLLARKIEERARERGSLTYRDAAGKERRLDQLEDKITFGGLYNEDDEEGLARDAYLNATNVEVTSWEEFQEHGIAPYTGVGKVMRSIGNACDIVPGEPVVPLTWHTEKKEPYPTLTRRIQFYIDHEWYLELGEALPVHKAPPKAGGDYPLQLTGGHARWSVHSDWVDDSLLLSLQRGEPVLFMSQGDARARGIEDAQPVEVYNDVGSFRALAVASPAVRTGQVVIYHAWENFQFSRWDHFKRVMPSPLNPIELVGGYFHIRPIPMNCHPGLNDRGTRVEVRRAVSEATGGDDRR
ncbi:MAG TPA: molybdopterin-dependent oxidoreductase, partial [Dehalococcoidia bacterium]|nr:molybdopterin-dependent oxidoreductase [Dehalococcoidia bacterium]